MVPGITLSVISSVVLFLMLTDRIAPIYAKASVFILHFIFIIYIRITFYFFPPNLDEHSITTYIQVFIESGDILYHSGYLFLLIMAYFVKVLGIRIAFESFIIFVNIVFPYFLFELLKQLGFAEKKQIIVGSIILNFDWVVDTINQARPTTVSTLLILFFILRLIKEVSPKDSIQFTANQISYSSNEENKLRNYIIIGTAGIILFFIHILAFIIWYLFFHLLLVYFSILSANLENMENTKEWKKIQDIRLMVNTNILFSDFIALTTFVVYRGLIFFVFENLSIPKENYQLFWFLQTTLILVNLLIIFGLNTLAKQDFHGYRFQKWISLHIIKASRIRMMNLLYFAILGSSIIFLVFFSIKTINRLYLLYYFEIQLYFNNKLLIIHILPKIVVFLIYVPLFIAVMLYRNKQNSEEIIIYLFSLAIIILAFFSIFSISSPQKGNNNWSFRFLEIGLPYTIISIALFLRKNMWLNDERAKIAVLIVINFIVSIGRFLAIYYSFSYS